MSFHFDLFILPFLFIVASGLIPKYLPILFYFLASIHIGRLGHCKLNLGSL